MHPRSAIAPLDLIGHVNVGRFALPVRGKRRIRCLCGPIVAKPNPTSSVPGRCNDNCAGIEFWRGGSKQSGFEELEEWKVCQVVRAKLGFKAIGCHLLKCCHDARIIDKNVERLAPFQ